MDPYIGPAGWDYADWRGAVYPSPAPRGFDPLAYLSRYFDCIEVNSTFYRIPSPRAAADWVRRTRGRGRFLFTAKLHRAVTHEEGAFPVAEAERFRLGITPLLEAGALGCLLAQFPWSFRDTAAARARLSRIADAFPGAPLAVEVRHKSWDTPAARRFFAERGMGLCAIDQPRFPSSMPPVAHRTARVGYVRLHGRNRENWFREGAGRDARYDYLYAPEELDPWAARIRGYAAEEGRVFVILNNHYRGKAVCNALEFAARLRGGRVAVPPPLLEAFPRLRAIASCAPPEALPGLGREEIICR